MRQKRLRNEVADMSPTGLEGAPWWCSVVAPNLPESRAALVLPVLRKRYGHPWGSLHARPDGCKGQRLACSNLAPETPRSPLGLAPRSPRGRAKGGLFAAAAPLPACAPGRVLRGWWVGSMRGLRRSLRGCFSNGHLGGPDRLPTPPWFRNDPEMISGSGGVGCMLMDIYTMPGLKSG